MFRRLLLLFALSAVPLAAQDYVALKRETFSSVANGSVVRLIGSAAGYHKLTWTVTGTVTACTVKVEQSATGTGGWSDLIAGQTCTSNGQSTIVTAVPNYIRIATVTSFTGGGSITAVYTGYVNDPSGGGAVGPGTLNALAKFATTTTVGDSSCSDDGTSVSCTVPISVNTSSTIAYDSGTRGYAIQVANNGTNGTVLNKLAELATSGTASTARIAQTTTTQGIIGVCDDSGDATCGTTGSGSFVRLGHHLCTFDSATTAGNAVVNDTSTAGDCMDGGSIATACAATSQVLGIVQATDADGGLVDVLFGNPCAPGGSGAYMYSLPLLMTTVHNPADGATRYWGTAGPVSATASEVVVHIPKTGTITDWYLDVYCIAAVGTETSTFKLSYNGGAGFGTITTDWDQVHTTGSATGLSQAVTAGGTLVVENVYPTWATTNPTGCTFLAAVVITVP